MIRTRGGSMERTEEHVGSSEDRLIGEHSLLAGNEVASVHGDSDGFLAIQKLNEWKRILENSGVSESHKLEIREKIKDVLYVMFKTNGKTREPDELISRVYYDLLDDIQDARQDYQSWKRQTLESRKIPYLSDYLTDPASQRLIRNIQGDKDNKVEPLFNFGKYAEYYADLEEKAEFILEEGQPNERALELTAVWVGLRKAYIRKKIRKKFK
jgi:hypothetical protein